MGKPQQYLWVRKQLRWAPMDPSGRPHLPFKNGHWIQLHGSKIWYASEKMNALYRDQLTPSSSPTELCWSDLQYAVLGIEWNLNKLWKYIKSVRLDPQLSWFLLVTWLLHPKSLTIIVSSIHVSMLFSWNIPPSPSPTESKRLFYKSVSLFLFCI